MAGLRRGRPGGAHPGAGHRPRRGRRFARSSARVRRRRRSRFARRPSPTSWPWPSSTPMRQRAARRRPGSTTATARPRWPSGRRCGARHRSSAIGSVGDLEAWAAGIGDEIRALGEQRKGWAQVASIGVNAVGTSAILAVFVHTGGLTGAEVGITAATAVVNQKLLEAIFGEANVAAFVVPRARLASARCSTPPSPTSVAASRTPSAGFRPRATWPSGCAMPPRALVRAPTRRDARRAARRTGARRGRRARDRAGARSRATRMRCVRASARAVGLPGRDLRAGTGRRDRRREVVAAQRAGRPHGERGARRAADHG